MWLDNEARDAINLFWRLAGNEQGFPRSLDTIAPLALPVAFTRISALELQKIESWLWQRRINFSFQCQSRAVRGCLVAYGGCGFIFADEDDLENEIRFTQAHEIAHFLLDYWLPRMRAVQKCGRSITEVLDGKRPPTLEERVYAIFGKIAIGVHTKLMEREITNEGIQDIWEIESRADKVALALLAPPEDVLHRADISQSRFKLRKDSVSCVLRDYFCLPDHVAPAYSAGLLSTVGKGPTWTENLRS